jgi:hypothetical protein
MVLLPNHKIKTIAVVEHIFEKDGIENGIERFF